MLACGAWLLLCIPAAHAQERSFNIEAGDLKAALDAYARQADVQLIYRIEDVRGLSSPGLKRRLPIEQAPALLLQGTPLKARRDVSGAIVIAGPAASRPPVPINMPNPSNP
ncbi:hypothetical protein G8A07_05085 [Roseateles sp. DAIF2]|uniref:STN domain-containing protein n=1 Tax=Roseateles sp. DAIF2 TaxID=2714952 RepID=UPI0018A27A55|nr:STN domain-containing protein [Roseateles sp. DAIF2]QPF72368.1 hypothetical protein G8A07_05085 [Roseateles sp. DAIF2]